MKDLMIILCVLLVILTLISILGGSIRYNEDPGPKVIQPDQPKPSPAPASVSTPTVSNKEGFQGKNTTEEKIKEILYRRKSDQTSSDNNKKKSGETTLEPFQGYEFAMF